MRARIVLYSEIGSIFGRMLEAYERLEFQKFALLAKINQRQTVAEDIVDPSDLSRFGNDLNTAIH